MKNINTKKQGKEDKKYIKIRLKFKVSEIIFFCIYKKSRKKKKILCGLIVVRAVAAAWHTTKIFTSSIYGQNM